MCNLFPHYVAKAKAAMTTRKAGVVCDKCAPLKKSGKHSCCAPGGTWFNKCGNAGDKDAHYSWLEGIRACDGFTVSFSGNEQPQPMLNHDAVWYALNATHERDGTHQIAVKSGVGGGSGESETGYVDCKCLHELAKAICSFSFSLAILTTS